MASGGSLVSLPASRRLHRAIALASTIALVSSACTGLLWAYSPYLYWDEGYMRKKAPRPGPPLTEAVVSVQDAMGAGRRAGRRGQVQSATLRSDFGRLLWEVQTRAGEESQPFLVDAITGETLSPLTAPQAALIAGQYVRGNPPVLEVVFEERFLGRSASARPVPAYRVRFQQARNPEIAIHRDTGVILADEDTGRRIHFFVANLHQLNYFGFKKTLTAAAGVPLLLLVITGLAMWLRPRLRRTRMAGRGVEAAAIAVLVTAAITGLAGAVAAQEKPVVVPLPEVTVDAPSVPRYVPDRTSVGTKTDTPLMDVPASVQSVPRELLYDQGAFTLDGFVRNVSGVQQSASSNYGFFSTYIIRGLASQFYRDGVLDASQVNGYVRTLTDVERVDVLKGPGSALYGSGAPGGTISLVSKQPTALPLYSAYGTGGSFGTYQFGTDMGGPLGETLGYRLNTNHYHTNGFRDVGSTLTEFVPLVGWRLAPGQTLTAKFDFRTIEAISDTVGIPFKGRTLVDIPRDTKLYSPFADTSQDVYRLALKLDSEVTEALVLQQNAAFMQRDLSLARNASSPTFAANGVTITGRNVRDQHDQWTDVIYQIEPVWKVDTGPLRHTILGGFQFQMDLLYTRRQTAALPNITDVYHDPVVPESNMHNLRWVPNFNRNSHLFDYAVYGQDQVALGPQWKWRGGMRWDHFDSFDHDRVTPYTRQRDNDKFSWDVGLAYQPVPDTSFYGGISKSYLSILTSEATPGAALPPESGLQYELGNRSQLLGGRIRTNLALFQTYRDNFLVTVGTNVIPVGKQMTEGIELDVSSEPLPGWVLWANYAYNTSELIKLSPADPSAGKGHSAVGVPENAAALWTTYEIQGGALRGVGGGGGFVYKGGVYLDTLNTLKLPQFAVGDFVVFYRTPHADFQVNVKNISNATYFFAGRNSAGAPGDPLSAYGTVTLRY
jgi:iron complex outermembrane receptor protein